MTILNLLLSLILSLVSIDEPKAAHDPLAAVQSDTVAATEAGPEQLAVLLARFDANSLSLITHLRPLDWTREREPLTPRGVEALVRTFESAIARDTQLNELVLRPQARALFFRDGALPSFAAVNERIYAEVFKTPAGDPWLGLANPLVFSALANDGLVARRGSSPSRGPDDFELPSKNTAVVVDVLRCSPGGANSVRLDSQRHG